MSNGSEYRIGLFTQDPTTVAAQQLAQSLDYAETLESVAFTDVLASRWSAYEHVGIHVFVDSAFGEEHIQVLVERLDTDIVRDNSSNLTVLLVYDTTEEKRMALRTYCSVCGASSLAQLSIDVLHRDEALITRPPGDEEGLQFVTFYYDVEAVSRDMEVGKFGFVPSDLRDSVKQKGIVPERFWYWDEESAILWHRLASPKSTYKLAEMTTRLLKDSITEVLQLIKDAPETKSDTIDFIDLGVGTPQKDRIVLEAIVHAMHASTAVTFFPMDISFPLLEYTLRRVLPLRAQLERGRSSSLKISIRPILGDFESLRQFEYQALLATDNTRLFALLGNTFGNLIEEDMMDCLATIMEDDDFLLLDAELVDDAKAHEITRQYYTDEMYDFVFRPLELLDFDKGTHDQHMEVELFEGHEIECRIIPWQGRKPRNLLHRVSSVPESEIVAMFYKTNRGRQALMAWSTKYNKKHFEEFLGRRFEICDQWRKGRYAMYLLRKAIGRGDAR